MNDEGDEGAHGASTSSDGATRVAVACQGGGSHTAFTAVALQRLLPAIAGDDYDLVGLSDTSGGAVCALLAWYGLAHPGEAPAALLGEFWHDLAARTPTDLAANDWQVRTALMLTMGLPVPQVSPYHNPGAAAAERRFRKLLERHVDFSAARALAAGGAPALLVSAIDVLTGRFHVFREDELGVEAVLASAAEPGCSAPSRSTAASTGTACSRRTRP